MLRNFQNLGGVAALLKCYKCCSVPFKKSVASVARIFKRKMLWVLRGFSNVAEMLINVANVRGFPRLEENLCCA